MNRRRAGLSEVIAGLLLVVIAITIGTLFFTYSSGILSSSSSEVLQSAASLQYRTKEKLVILDVHNDSAALYISVFSYGKLNLEIADVYVNNEQVDVSYLEKDQFTPADAEIQVGELTWIKVLGVTLGDENTLVLATERGNSFRLFFTPTE